MGVSMTDYLSSLLFRTLWRGLAGLAAITLVSCASTGGPLGLSPAQEQAIGEQEHPKIVAAFGGELEDPQLKAYVQRIHDDLIAASSQPDAEIKITLLDSPVVNAMALPGHTYITRGLLALANSEAELAGVMGHEIGHIYARHTAKRVSRGNLSQIGTVAVAILTGDQDIAQMAGQMGQLYLLRFSREQEYEADQYGVRMLAAAGYDPVGQAAFLNTLGRWSNLEAQISGVERPPEFLSTHPNTAERVQRAAQEAQLLNQNRGNIRRSAYLNEIDNLLYGDDPVKQGFIRGRDFIHPELGIAFRAPSGFELINSSQAVYGRAQNGAQMQFIGATSNDGPAALINGPLAQALKIQFPPAQSTRINGRDAAMSAARANTNSGAVDVTVYAIRWQGASYYVFMWVTPAAQTSQMRNGIFQSVQSLSTINPASVDIPPAVQIDVVTVQSGDTVNSLGARMAFPSHKVERFQIINALDGNETLRAGDRVKLVR